MKSKSLGNGKYILVLDKGDEVMESIISFAKKENIKSAAFNGIGATKPTAIGYFDLDKKEYEFAEIKEGVELLNIHGNITKKDDEYIVHAHVVLGDKNKNAIGGHLKKAVVSVTLELFIQTFESDIKRKKDEFTGLSLIELEKA